MSDFIYNDNLNGGGKEPIHFYLSGGKSKSGVSTTALVLVCVFCVIISATLGVIGGMLAFNNSDSSNGNEVIINDIHKSPYEAMVSDSFGSQPSRADIIESIKDTVVEVRTEYAVFQNYFTQSGAGSGVIVGKYKTEDKESGEITEQGYHVITNAHVIEDAYNSKKSTITVTLTDGTSYDASVLGFDVIGDIAILKIQETKELPIASFANDNYELRVGEDVIAIGNPLGQLGGTVTNGYISALDRKIEIDGIKMNLLQVDAPINPGNSGGGLFNLRGELVGVVNAKSIGTEIEGLGFAIPAKDACQVYQDFVTLGYATNRPTIFAEFDMEYKNGVYVSKVHQRDTGDNSSVLEAHDQIYGIVINGKDYAITSAAELTSIINSMEIGSELTLYIRRNISSREKITVTIYEYYE